MTTRDTERSNSWPQCT